MPGGLRTTARSEPRPRPGRPAPADRFKRLSRIVLVLLATVAATASDSPSRMQVPAALMRENQGIEASGVVWAPKLDRFLVISDDTGTEDHKHRPWMFAMTRQGALDANPIAIRGIDELNDAEAICAGPEGTFFLTTSHSENKKGKSRPARRMLLQLRLSGRDLAVEGRLDLTTATDANGHGLLEIAGVDPAGTLDIEGLSWSAGALFIGLKSPLASDGSAVILRLDHAVEAFRSGRIAPGSLTRFREAALPANHGGATVHRGISDLLSLPDGSLVVLANSPKGLPSDDGGAMFWLRPGSGSATLLREFPGLKPEGVTLAEDGRGLVVVFDTDREPPLWTRVPLPR